MMTSYGWVSSVGEPVTSGSQLFSSVVDLGVKSANAILPALIAREVYGVTPDISKPVQFDARGNLVQGAAAPAAIVVQQPQPPKAAAQPDYMKYLPYAIGGALVLFLALRK